MLIILIKRYHLGTEKVMYTQDGKYKKVLQYLMQSQENKLFAYIIHLCQHDQYKLTKENWMKAHKYWSIGALITMICTFLTGHMNKMIHAGFGLITLICMIMSVYSGHKMTSRKNQIKSAT